MKKNNYKKKLILNFIFLELKIKNKIKKIIN